ncbi:HNH endonuclease [Novosphingobium sp. EMRT-2]|uniref:HNH endonuclease n=1 Tax=Novosphingobium sp. EMRT-2 TaxID=2571749 RepID=UPI0010BD851E|nr:HNH endonuclease [Novosphingobium sp. EMRT-2]QCI92580.1 HNH endonuclease [Novosphingobium sp. EMRT-2]
MKYDNHCVYCGTHIDLERDHVIPNSYLRLHRSYDGDWLVSACATCNRLAGASLVFSVPEKAELLIGRYRRKYRRQLKTCVTEKDIEDTHGHFKNYLISQRNLHIDLMQRLHFLEKVSQAPLWWKGVKWFKEATNDNPNSHQDWKITVRKTIKRGYIDKSYPLSEGNDN